MCVLDTDVVIGALDRLDAHHHQAARLIPRLVDDGDSLHLSVINYAEVLVKPAQNADTMRRAWAVSATPFPQDRIRGGPRPSA